MAQTVKITPASGLLEFIGNTTSNKPYLQHDDNGNLTLTLQATKKFTVAGNLKVNGKVTMAQQTLTDGAAITWDFNSGANARVTIAGARTLVITNMEVGDTGLILVKQDTAGSRTLTLPGGSSIVGGGSYTASTAANATDVLGVYYDGTTYWWTIGYNTVATPLTSVGITGSDFTISNSPLTSNGNIGLALATVNSNVGSFGSASAVPVITVNAKGLITAVSTTNISIPTNLDSLTDVTITSATTGQLLQFNGSQWVNWTPNYLTGITSSQVTTALGYTPVPTTRSLTINGTAYDLSADRTWTINTVSYVSRVQHGVKAGVAINKGQAVYVTSADGTNMIVGLASNTSEATSSKTMGLLDATVAINGMANVVTEGLLAGLDTSLAGSEGDPVWLGQNGNLIFGLANKPYAPNHLVFIGIVTRKNQNNGEIFVKVQNGFELREIHDVDLISTVPVSGHILGYDGTLWVNKTIASWLGFTPANDANVVHTSGNETISGIKTFSGTTQATSTSTGTIVTAGGVGIAKNLYVGGDINVVGNLIIGGTTTTVNAQNLTVSDNMIYLNNGIATTITNAVGNGSTVVYTTAETHNYTTGMSVTITGVSPIAYNLSNQTITAVSTNSFTIANTATGLYSSGGTARAKSNANPDLGFAAGYNDGSYAHAGLFRDATDGIWKFFKGYTPEPDASAFIDTSHASFALANLQAYDITGNSFIKSGGTSSQFLKADGSVDSSTYLTTGTASSTYQPLDADLTAIAALATTGFLKRTGSNTWSLDSNTYLTSYTETDTLATVTGRGATTSTATSFTGGATITGLTVAKSGTDSLITFPAQTNDAGYIKHYESANTAIMYFNVSDDSNDFFHFGYTGNTGAFQLRSDGVVTVGTWQGTAIADSYISSAATWNAKQAALSGSGIVKSASGTISYISGTSSQFIKGDGSLDSSTYLTTGTASSTYLTISTASSTYLPLAGGTITGKVTFPSTFDRRPQFPGGILGLNTGDGDFDIWGISTEYYPSHATAANAWGLRWNGTNNDFEFVGGGTNRVVLDMDSGNITSTGSVTASSFVRSGGTSSQFLKADGSIDSSTYATQGYVTTAVSNLVASAPAALDTLNELASALGNDASFSTTVSTALGNRLRVDINTQGLTSTQKSYGRTNLGVVIGTDVQAWDADLDAIAGLAGTSGFLKKTAANTWSLDTNTYITGNQTITLSGDVTGSGTTSISTTLANTGVTASTYKSVTVDAKGRVTAGSNPTTLAGYGITNAVAYGDYITQSTFSNRTITVNPVIIKELLFGGTNRFTTTDTTTGIYPNAGSTRVITYQLNNGENSVYSSGNVYLGFWVNSPPADVTVRVRNTSGTWYGPYQGVETRSGGSCSSCFAFWKIPCGGPNYIDTWEITMTPQAGLSINLQTVNIAIDNSEGIDQFPIVHRDGSTMYGRLNFMSGGGVRAYVDPSGTIYTSGNITASSFIKAGGTSVQFLKADGSVDSSAYITGINSTNVTNALGYTPVTNARTLTINGTAYDLTANRSWSVGTVTSVGGTGTVSGLTLSGTVTGSGNLTLGGTLSLTSSDVTTALGYTPVTNARTLTINGTTYDLSANRSWTIASAALTLDQVVTNGSTSTRNIYIQGSQNPTQLGVNGANSEFWLSSQNGGTSRMIISRNTTGNQATLSFATGLTWTPGTAWTPATPEAEWMLGTTNNTGDRDFKIGYADIYGPNNVVISINYSNRFVGILKNNAQYELDVNGTVAATQLVELSSLKYKTNVESLTPALDKIMHMRPVTYIKKGADYTEIGLIAEEVAEIYPELVQYAKDGSVDSLNYTRIAPILIKTIQEQQALIKNLTKRIDDLENR